MQDAEELYSKTVARLSPNERLRLASLILNGILDARFRLAFMEGFVDGLAQETEKPSRSVLDLLDDLPEGGRFLKTPAEADVYLREERDSWDR